jgi:hypothetical protein
MLIIYNHTLQVLFTSTIYKYSLQLYLQSSVYKCSSRVKF